MAALDKKPEIGPFAALKTVRLKLNNGWVADIALSDSEKNHFTPDQWTQALSKPTELLENPEKVLKCLTDIGFTLTDGSLTDVETLFCGLEEFRQHLGGRLTLTMLRNVGDAIDVHQVQRDQMVKAIEYVMRYASVQSHLA